MSKLREFVEEVDQAVKNSYKHADSILVNKARVLEVRDYINGRLQAAAAGGAAAARSKPLKTDAAAVANRERVQRFRKNRRKQAKSGGIL